MPHKREFEKPWLPSVFPELFLSVAWVIICHIGLGLQTILDPAQYDVPGYTYLNEWMDPLTLGRMSLIAGLLMFVGLHRRTLALMRVGVGLGELVALIGTVAIGAAWWNGIKVGVGFWIWLALVGSHIARLIVPAKRHAEA